MTVSEAGKKGGMIRGEQMKGEGNGNAKITRKQAQAIKKCEGKISLEDTATSYGLHKEHVRKIWRGVYWKDV